MRNILFLASKIDLRGAPKTRMEGFKESFIKHGGTILSGKKKLFSKLNFQKANLLYVESATNRLTLRDIFTLSLLKCFSKYVIVFIRDVYIDYFPENYKGFRGKLTLNANRLTYSFLIYIANHVVFPTKSMGEFYFGKNSKILRTYSALPPGTIENDKRQLRPDLNAKLGIVYLGNISYEYSGFNSFIKFQKLYNKEFNFFVLTNDQSTRKLFSEEELNTSVFIDFVPRAELAKYISDKNIAFALHTRGRNTYDDMTFPIKVLDYLSMRLPFVSELHPPIVELVGKDYELLCSVSDSKGVYNIIKNGLKKYDEIVEGMDRIAQENTYAIRYKTLIDITKSIERN